MTDPRNPERPVRVLVVDDDALVRNALTMMLDGADGIRVVAEGSDGEEALALADAHGPDVVLMDVRMPRLDGITATRRLRARPRPPEVVVLTTFDTDENVLHALRAGATGFLLKDIPPGRIVEAVRQAAAGEPMLSSGVIRRLMRRITTAGDTLERARRALSALSAREHEVALAVARGGSNAEIASELDTSVATVKAHISHALTKLALDNRTQIAVLVHDAELR
ncbi:DNA-binding NarL/FixJ family response regulator [Amycolatopsis endophytica]|uniref:DNA-binding NarL/FixJ family response regulator n=1 Tax=Amycolatopsis endophytica TaxID=860233 RepID=A0A853B8K2_9PSEU|nr:response regulator transcription factor [Amycolatopsis endophytica]NYI91449.1 DNA-binding NarL/FixJ family response regulator [Amycolatopsis endophytica]